MRRDSLLGRFIESESAVSSTECALLVTLFVVTFIGMLTGYVPMVWLIAPAV